MFVLTNMLVAIRVKLAEIQATYAIKLAEFEALGQELSDGRISDKERAALLAEFDKVAEKYRYETSVYEEMRVDNESELAATKELVARIELDRKTTAASKAEEVVFEM